MQVVPVKRNMMVGGVEASGQFGIRADDIAHIMRILRDTLYTDKIGAVLREYGSNAWDVHRVADKDRVPIKVTLPTDMDPVLSIRDFGTGMSDETVIHLFTQYGASTKRDDNIGVGMLGIGCLIKGQPIVTPDGMKFIERIQIGDWVLTHRNRFRRVTETMRRHHKGRAFKVWLSQTKTPLILTERHPLLVGDSEGNTQWLPACEIKDGYCNPKRKGIKEWNSYAVLPAAIEVTQTALDVASVLEGEGIFFDNGECCRRLLFGYKRHYRGIPHDEIGNTRTTTWPGFPQTLELDEDLGWVLGLFAAEGSCSFKALKISLNIDETGFAHRFETIMRSKFGVSCKWYPRPDRTLLELVIDHLPLTKLFGHLCGKGAKNKKIPDCVLQGPEAIRKGFLDGVLDGDGSSTRPHFVFGVASPRLAWGVRTLMAIQRGDWKSVDMERYHRWSVTCDRGAPGRFACSFRSGDYLFRPIVRMEAFDLDADVYNFSVEEDDSYVSNCILHNSKSAFCYSDTFTVISWYAGTKRTYVMALDKEDKGLIFPMGEEPCGEEVGIEIQIPIKQRDVWEFRDKATKLFRWYDPRPEINISIPDFQRIEVKHGFVLGTQPNSQQSSVYEWVAVMGCVPYRINMSQVQDLLARACIWEAVCRMGGGLYFEIGEVTPSANREELKYDDKTKTAIVERIDEVLREYLNGILANVRGMTLSDWEKRIQIQTLTYQWQGSIFPDDIREYAGPRVNLWDPYVTNQAPKTFTLISPSDESVHSLPVDSETRLVLKDDPRQIKGFRSSLDHLDYVVRPNRKNTIAEVKVELEAILTRTKTIGIPMVNISSFNWNAVTASRSHGADFRKYHSRMFRLLDASGYYHYPWSSAWEVEEEHEPDNDDLYVILSEFLPRGIGVGFYNQYRQDRVLIETLGGTMPEIYGYKTTSKDPINESELKGTPYLEWRKTYLTGLTLSSGIRDLVTCQQWAEVIRESWRNTTFRYNPELIVDQLTTTLGADHRVTRFFDTVKKSRLTLERSSSLQKMVIPQIIELFQLNNEPNPAAEMLESILTRYPLFRVTEDGLHLVYEDKSAQQWMEYIQLVDNAEKWRLEAEKKAPEEGA